VENWQGQNFSHGDSTGLSMEILAWGDLRGGGDKVPMGGDWRVLRD
jgi:hypothetical protein